MNRQTQILNFLRYLISHGVSPKSLKYYKSDLVNFLTWANERRINQTLINEYVNSIRVVTPTSTLNRRLSTLRSYGNFLGFKKIAGTWQEGILNKFTSKPKFQTFLNKLLFSRPNWYRKYHSYPLASYIHIAILVLFTSLAGYALYDQVFKNPNSSSAFPTALTRPNRYMSFQGRLTDNLGNPKTVATNMVFKLYSVSTGGVALWNSGTCSITPDQDGVFSTLLGSSCGAEIASSVFSENASIWLGATMGADSEATPRVQIATVAYALNAETLQGYPAGTGTSTIPYINSSGSLVLANASPTIQSTSGTFAVEGLAMTITTPTASNGIITINPDGVGTLDLTFEGAAAGLSANGFVNATNANITSGALYGGTVASAATGYNFVDFQSGVSPTSKFSVSATGAITTASGLTIGTTSLSETTSPTDSGAYLVGTFDEFGNSSSANVQDVLDDLDAAITTAGGAPTWSSIIAPTANLSLAHAGYTTAFTFDSVTAADAFALSSTSLTTGTLFNLSSTSTAGGASGVSKLLDISRSGTNANASHTAYGVYSAVTNTNVTSGTNIAGYFSASGATTANYGLIVANGSVGIGTTGPDAKLDSLATTEQLRLTYTDGTVYSSFTVDSAGDLTITPSGGDLSITGNLTATGTTGLTLSGTGGDITFALGEKIDNDVDGTLALTATTTALSGNLKVTGGNILNSVGTASIIFSAAPTTTANTLSGSNWLIENTANLGQAALMVNQTKAGDLFTASASGTPKFVITNAGNVGIGTTGPGGPLHVKGNNGTYGTIAIQGAGTTGNASLGYLTFFDSDGTTRRGYFGDGASADTDLYLQAETGKLHIGDSSGGDVIVLSAGNVGIGTTDPTSKLSIVHDQNASTQLAVSNSTNGTAARSVLVTTSASAASTFSFGLGSLSDNYDTATLGDLAPGNNVIYTAGNPTAGKGNLLLANRSANAANYIGFYTGASTLTSTSERMRISNGGNVGIGTTAPERLLDINGALRVGTYIYSPASYLGLLTDAGAALPTKVGSLAITSSYSNSAPTNGLYVQGNVGIADTTPSYPLDVTGDINTTTGYRAGGTCMVGSCSSDERLKKNIQSLTGSLDLINNLNPVTFEFNDPLQGLGTITGLIAQQVEQIAPDWVSIGTDGYKRINYGLQIEMRLIGAIKELNSKIDKLTLSETGDIVLTGDSPETYTVTTPTGITDRIGAFAEATIAKLKVGIGSFRQVETSLISPVANADLIIDLQPDNSQIASELIIKGENDEVVTSFDAQGNATISGTLYADKIESTRLSEIEDLLSEVENNQQLLTDVSTWNVNTATSSGQFTDLFVTGQAAISSLFVSDNFTTKNINSLTESLQIQSLAASPLEIMAGKIVIDTEGNTKFLGNVEIAGDLKINNIIVANNINPEATVSGTIVEGEINTNATAGTAVLPAGLAELKINNEKLKINSLIYITPVTSTQNKVLYVKSKSPSTSSGQVGEFTIGFNEAIDTDVEFNWWIIELGNL
ncbi:MAG: complement C1q protein [uncultured bacterium]|nr:MAG: complement C1q protein [uncultured bacterium]